jgi:hypothetical protein
MQTAFTNQHEQRSIKLPSSEGWVTVVLATLFILIPIAAMQHGQWTPHLDMLTPTALFGCALGFVLAKQRVVPQVLADIPALIVGSLFVAALGMITQGDVVPTGCMCLMVDQRPMLGYGAPLRRSPGVTRRVRR